MVELENVFFPDRDEDSFRFECPVCGKEVRPPAAGHVWVCHETYGGCGAKFRPVKGFKRIDG